jgi:hypothetical protein
MTAPVILLDEPEEGYCESHGWVSVDLPIDEAAKALAGFCLDEDGDPGYVPQGAPARVWLRPECDDVESMWVPCDEGADSAREFYEFDVTDTEAIR